MNTSSAASSTHPQDQLSPLAYSYSGLNPNNWKSEEIKAEEDQKVAHKDGIRPRSSPYSPPKIADSLGNMKAHEAILSISFPWEEGKVYSQELITEGDGGSNDIEYICDSFSSTLDFSYLT